MAAVFGGNECPKREKDDGAATVGALNMDGAQRGREIWVGFFQQRTSETKYGRHLNDSGSILISTVAKLEVP